LADTSLRIPLSLIVRDYSAREGRPVTLWFASTGAMIDAIREGADADIVITADATALTLLEQSGQIDVYATKPVASSPLVLAAPTGTTKPWRFDSSATMPLVVIASPHSLEDPLSQKALAESSVLKNRTIDTHARSTVDDAVTLMQSHQFPGLLLAAEVFSLPKLEVVHRFNWTADYKAAVLAGEHMAASRHFIVALAEPSAHNHFKAYGLRAAR
jgi:ABC-type molybdate transport system substrate-binding protein